MTAEEIVAAALKRDHKERARLAGRLLQSLDEEEEKLTPAEVDALWLEEAERRLKEWEQGKVEGIPGDRVMKEFRRQLALAGLLSPLEARYPIGLRWLRQRLLTRGSVSRRFGPRRLIGAASQTD